MKNHKKVLLPFLMFVLLISMSFNVQAAVKINKSQKTMYVGQKYKLSVKGTGAKVTWKTANKRIATVSTKGVVTAKKKGKTTITAVVKKKTYKCTLTVKSPKLADMKASVSALETGKKKKVLFTVKKLGTMGSIYLYEDNTKVGLMHDDGKKGDKKKNDGIYSLSVSMNQSKPVIIKFYAKSGTKKSSKISVSFYDKPNASDKKTAKTVVKKFDAINDKYEQSNGKIVPAKVGAAVKEAASYAKKLVASGDALYYEKGDTSVTCKMSTGLSIVFQANVSGYDSGCDSVGSSTSMNIITMQPCKAGYPSKLASYMKMPDTAASKIEAEFSNYSFGSNLDDSKVTLDRIKKIGKNQVIIWHGHGGYNWRNHSFLVTGEKFSWNKWFCDTEYWLDCVTDRILESNGHVMITSKFITKYCGDMDNSLLYLAACESGKDSTLADAFLSKGAKAVVGNTASILTIYNVNMQYTTLERMTNLNPSTRNYYTLNEALSYAKNKHGADDGTSDKAYPKIFGGSAAKGYQFGQAKNGMIDGKVINASDRSTPIAGATVKVIYRGRTIKTVTSKADGSYSVSTLPGSYQLDISASGYLPFTCYAEVEQGQTEYMESFLMISGSENDRGTAYGYISHGTTGSKLSGVLVQLRKGWNNTSAGTVIANTSTGSSGYYEFQNLPIGHYTANISKSGFVATSFNIIVSATSDYEQNGVLAEKSTSDSYQIVLTWGQNPRDVDSHMVGTMPSGYIFHTYFSNKQAYFGDSLICNLDTDERYGYGPETISLKVNNTTPYYYYVKKYAGDGYLSSSNAQVKVYKGGKLIGTYHVPTNQGTGDYWNVFAIVNGEIKTRNTITTGDPDISYQTVNTAVSNAAKASLQLNNDNNTSNTLEGTEPKD